MESFHALPEFLQFGCGNDKLCVSAVQADQGFLADVDRRQVESFRPGESNRQFALEFLLVRGRALLTWHFPSRYISRSWGEGGRPSIGIDSSTWSISAESRVW